MRQEMAPLHACFPRLRGPPLFHGGLMRQENLESGWWMASGQKLLCGPGRRVRKVSEREF